MMRTYVDESASSEVYFVASLTIPEEAIFAFECDLSNLQNKLCEIFLLQPDMEFHGYDIWHGHGIWLNVSMEDRQYILSHLLDLILRNDVKISIKGIRKAHFEPRYGKRREVIHNAALIWNLEKVQKYASVTGRSFQVIADHSGPTDKYYRSQLEMFQVFETFGWDPVVLNKMCGNPIFMDSTQEYGLQAIDIVAFVFMRSQSSVKNLKLLQFQNSLVQKLYNSRKLIYLGIWP